MPKTWQQLDDELTLASARERLLFSRLVRVFGSLQKQRRKCLRLGKQIKALEDEVHQQEAAKRAARKRKPRAGMEAIRDPDTPLPEV